MRATAAKDSKLAKALRDILNDDELWQLHKLTGHEINLVRDYAPPPSAMGFWGNIEGGIILGAGHMMFGAHTAYNCPGISEKVTHLAFGNLLEELQCPLPS